MEIQQIAQQFIDWTKKKIRHHIKEEKKELYFREREIWWAALGQNIGYEINGKHEFFTRPVLVVKKYSGTMCFVLPLTTQIKKDNPPYQYLVKVGDKQSAINLSQGRTISSKRLLQKEGVVPSDIFGEITDRFIALLLKK